MNRDELKDAILGEESEVDWPARNERGNPICPCPGDALYSINQTRVVCGIVDVVNHSSSALS